MKEQNKEIDLLWESFYFYTEQISKEEITREDNLEKFNYLLINEKSISASRKSVFLKYYVLTKGHFNMLYTSHVVYIGAVSFDNAL